MFKAFAITGLAATVAMYTYADDYYWVKAALGCLVLSVVIGAIVAQRIHWSIGLSYAWTLSSLVYIAISFYPKHELPQSIMKMSVESAAHGTIVFLISTVPLLFMTSAWVKSARIALSLICLLSSFVVITQFLLGHEAFYRGGLFGNSSLNASMIAVLYPVLLAEKSVLPHGYLRLVKSAPPVVAVLLAGSTIGGAALLVAVASYGILYKTLRTRTVAAFGVLAAASVSGMVFTYGLKGLVDSSGRFAVWTMVLEYFKNNVNHYVGIGQGMAFFGVPAIQFSKAQAVGHVQSDMFFSWLHNEWLQVLFEQGLIGLLFMGLSFAFCVRAALQKKRKDLIAAFITLAFVGFFNYPLRAFVPGIIVCSLVMISFKDESHA